MLVIDPPLPASPPTAPSSPDEQAGTDAVGQRWLAGDPGALRLAYDRWGPALHRYCARRLPTEDAADATQEIFVSAWRAREQFDPSRGELPQWLFGIARTTCVTFHRRRARTPEPVADLPAGADATEDDDPLADRLILSAALATLPERQRRVLRASFVDGWTNQEVSERLQLPLGTVKSDIRRGLLAMRAQLGGMR